MYNQFPAYSNLDDLRQWFFDQGRPLWAVYDWFEAKSPPANRRIATNLHKRNLEEAWEMLESLISAQASLGGAFTIKVDNQPQFKNSYMTRIAINNRTQPHSIAGVQPGQPGSNYLTIDELERRMEIYDLKRKNEDLEHELEAAINGSPMERIANRLLESDQLSSIVNIFASKILGPTVSLNGFGVGAAPSQGDPSEGISEEEQQMIIQKAWGQIQEVFPDVPTFLAKLGNWIEANPETAKSLFDSVE